MDISCNFKVYGNNTDLEYTIQIIEQDNAGIFLDNIINNLVQIKISRLFQLYGFENTCILIL